MPKLWTDWRRAGVVSRRDRPANAVLHPWAKSVANVGLEPVEEDACWSLNSWPPTLAVLVHGTWVLVENPVPSSAAVDTMVNASPGETRAFSAPPAGRSTPATCWPATARTLPVEAWTATISAANALHDAPNASAEIVAVWT